MSDGSSSSTGQVASTIESSFTNISKLITAGSYLAGLGFSIGAIMKFKQHKDNPTQIPIGTPVALVFIAAALLFLPTILSVAGVTGFGGGAKLQEARSDPDQALDDAEAVAAKTGISPSTVQAAAAKVQTEGPVLASEAEAAGLTGPMIEADAAAVLTEDRHKAEHTVSTLEKDVAKAGAAAESAGVTAAGVQSAVDGGGITASQAESAAAKAGIPASEIAAAERSIDEEKNS